MWNALLCIRHQNGGNGVVQMSGNVVVIHGFHGVVVAKFGASGKVQDHHFNSKLAENVSLPGACALMNAVPECVFRPPPSNAPNLCEVSSKLRNLCRTPAAPAPRCRSSIFANEHAGLQVVGCLTSHRNRARSTAALIV